MTRNGLFGCVLVLGLSTVAWAAKDKMHDLSTPELALAAAEDAGVYATAKMSKPQLKFTDGKPIKRLVITRFMVEWDFSMMTHGPVDYFRKLTDDVHARFVTHATAAGFEIVPFAEAVATPAYATFKDGTDIFVGDGFASAYAPTGWLLFPFKASPAWESGRRQLIKDTKADAYVDVTLRFHGCQFLKTKGYRSCLTIANSLGAPLVVIAPGFVEQETKGGIQYNPVIGQPLAISAVSGVIGDGVYWPTLDAAEFAEYAAYTLTGKGPEDTSRETSLEQQAQFAISAWENFLRIGWPSFAAGMAKNAK